MQIARAYLHVADSAYSTRTWADVFGHIISNFKSISESARSGKISEKDKAYDLIRQKLVSGLMNEGHNFIDDARNESHWKTAMTKIGTTVGSASLEIIKAIIAEVAKAGLGLK